MKYKSIEKIPYLTLPACSRKKDAKYVCVTDIIEVQQEKHLFLEIYRNEKTDREIPVARVVLAKKDYSTYFPKQASWSGKQLEGNSWDDDGILEKIEPKYRSLGGVEKNFILSSQKDRDRIETYCQGITVWKKENWWDFVNKKQEQIRTDRSYERWKRKQERRQRALDECAAATPELPEQKIIEYAEGSLFHHKHYLYYKKHGCRARIICSSCGQTGDWRWKPGISYESQLESMMEEPRHGYYGSCPMCGAGVQYFAAGKAKTCEREKKYLFLGQKYKENGMLIRYIGVEKEWNLELAYDKTGPVMMAAGEEISGVEIARAYFEPGEKVQIDFHKHSGYSGEDFWDDCNLSGNANITIREAKVMPETYQALKESYLRYSALEIFQEAAGDVQVIDYLERYTQIPQIEMLVKMNMIQVVKRLVWGYCSAISNEKADRIDGFMGIRKDRVKMLAAERGNVDLLDVLKQEKRCGQVWTEEQIRKLEELKGKMMLLNIETAMKYMTLQKLLNRIEKYAGCRFGTGCTEAQLNLRHTAQTYLDYLNMREKLGYDLTNSVYQNPRDLQAAHDKMVLEQDKEEIDKRMKEVEEKYPNIRRKYRKLRKKYCYADDKYFIRPAASASEIVLEGRILHHCVGGDTYLGRHDRGTSYILLLRHRDKPNEPYITIEIHAENGRIMQWYGAYDKKPDEKPIQEWIDRYTDWLEAGGVEAGSKAAGEETGRQMLATA